MLMFTDIVVKLNYLYHIYQDYQFSYEIIILMECVFMHGS